MEDVHDMKCYNCMECTRVVYETLPAWGELFPEGIIVLFNQVRG